VVSSNEPNIEQAEQQAATALGIERERAGASGDGGTYSEATEAMIDSVQASSDDPHDFDLAPEEVEFLHAQGGGSVGGEAAEEEPQTIDFAELSEHDARSVLFNGLVEQNARLVEVEQRLMLLAQSFVRILEAAGAAEEGTQPQVVVAQTMPKMAVPSSKVAHPTRNSR
jgi:hypothetical protein